MTLLARTGSFNLSTGSAGTQQTITGVGFTPRLVLFWGSGRTATTDGAAAASIQRFFGAATATAGWSVATQSESAQATTDNDRAQDITDCIIVQPAGVEPAQSEHRMVSVNGDGFVIEVTDATTPIAARVHYLALGGSDLTDVAVGQLQMADLTPGNISVTSLSFQPEFVLIAHTGQGSAINADNPHAVLGIGMATSAAQQGMVTNQSNNAQAAGEGLSSANAAEIWGHINAINTPNINGRAEFVSMNVNGFTINIIENNTGDVGLFWVALRGGRHRVGNIATRTDGNNIVTTGVGVGTPSSVFMVSDMKAATAVNSSVDHASMSIGAFTGATERRASATMDVAAADPTATFIADEHDQCYIRLDTSGNVVGLMDAVSMDSDGFTTVMDDPDPDAAFVLYWAAGSEVAPSGPVIGDAGAWVDGAVFTVTGTGFGTQTGSASLTVGGVAQTNITSWTDTVITGIASLGNHPFGTNRNVVVTNSAAVASAAVAIQWQVAAGETFVTITDVSMPASWRFVPSPDLAVNDQFHARNFVGISVADFQLLTNGTWIANNILLASFEGRVWDASDQTWGPWAVQTVLLSVDPGPGPGPSPVRTKAIDCLSVN